MKYELDGKEVEIIELDIEIGESCECIDACWADNGLPLTEGELEHLNAKYASELYQSAFEDAAARVYDQAKDAWKYGED